MKSRRGAWISAEIEMACVLPPPFYLSSRRGAWISAEIEILLLVTASTGVNVRRRGAWISAEIEIDISQHSYKLNYYVEEVRGSQPRLKCLFGCSIEHYTYRRRGAWISAEIEIHTRLLSGVFLV